MGTLEDVEQRLIDEGYDPLDVEELLYDPAPRKRGKKYKRRPRARSYDPAPLRSRVATRYRTVKEKVKRRIPKGIMAKVKKFVLPGTAGVTFYAAYIKRAEDLFNQGLISEKSVFKAIEYDIKNFNTNDAMGRLKNNAGEIITPFLGGFLMKETKILGKYTGVAADALFGMGIGVGAKTILDPPVIQSQKRMVQVKTQTGNGGCPGCTGHTQTQAQVTAGRDFNPYGGY